MLAGSEGVLEHAASRMEAATQRGRGVMRGGYTPPRGLCAKLTT
jgi:hypothetical protein